MAKDDSKIYDNKNGYYTDEEMLNFKHMKDEDFTEFLRHFNCKIHKCPPLKYKMADCFYCIRCLRNARELTREKKVK